MKGRRTSGVSNGELTRVAPLQAAADFSRGELPVLGIIIRLIGGLLLFGLGAFFAIMSPFITDPGTQEAIHAFEIVLCVSVLVAATGIALFIWGIVGLFRR